MEKVILLTGSTGMIGRNLKELLPVLSPTHQELDLTNLNQTNKYLSATSPEMIIHCASNDDEICLEDNLRMFLNLAETKIPMITFCTGREVENRSSHASGQYILSKYITKELALTKYNHILVIKLWGCCGKYEKPIRFITSNLLRVKQGLPILVGENKLFSYVYVGDLAKIIEYIPIEQRLISLVGYTKTLLEYAQIIKKVTGSPHEIIVEKENFYNSYVGKTNFSFQPTPIEQVIQEMYEC